jgi:ribosomal-protein-alanine N-acetyltransferase
LCSHLLSLQPRKNSTFHQNQVVVVQCAVLNDQVVYSPNNNMISAADDNSNHTSFELLQTERLILRRPTKDDANAIFFSSYPTDPEVTKYLLFPPHKSIQDTLKFIEWSDEVWKDGGFNFIILSKADEGKVIGGVGISRTEVKDSNKSEKNYPTGVARVGYCIARDEWGKGYATEACKKMIELAMEHGITKLVAPVHPDNLRSIRVLEKCGFQEDEGTSETLVLPNLNESRKVKLVGFARSLSLSEPPPTLTWED